MEEYESFIFRISEFETRELHADDLANRVHSGLIPKVREDGSFRQFYGDTVVFALPDKALTEISSRLDSLIQRCPSVFAERFRTEMLHMTLHDLNAGSELEAIAPAVFRTGIQICRTFSETNLPSEKIEVKSTYLFNMVNTSLVMGLIPASRHDFETLFALYEKIDKIKPLEYPFTPHITLAYFIPKIISRHDLNTLKAAVEELNEEQLNFELSTDELYYQHFTDMNTFINIKRLNQS